MIDQFKVAKVSTGEYHVVDIKNLQVLGTMELTELDGDEVFTAKIDGVTRFFDSTTTAIEYYTSL